MKGDDFMKKFLTFITVFAIGFGVAYLMDDSKATSSDVQKDRYGSFETFEAGEVELSDYLMRYSVFYKDIESLDSIYAYVKDSYTKGEQYKFAGDYVEEFIYLQEEIFVFNDNNKVPSAFKDLHESLIKEIGIADLITEEFEEAIESNDFSTIEELRKLAKTTHMEALEITDQIEYNEAMEEFILKD